MEGLGIGWVVQWDESGSVNGWWGSCKRVGQWKEVEAVVIVSHSTGYR